MEYRICWSASSNISFKGSTGWKDAEDWGEDEETVSLALQDGVGQLPHGLEEAIDASGFEWWVETRGEADNA